MGDEAHHMLPCEWAPASAEIAGDVSNTVLVTVHPKHVSPAALRLVKTVLVVGKAPHETLQELAKAIAIQAPECPADDLAQGEALVWFRDSNEIVPKIQVTAPRTERNRHKRKYAEGELEPERVFWFRGSHDKLHLRAQNLNVFLQIAEGIETLLFHLGRGDYSNWFRNALKDSELADEIRQVESDKSLSPIESRERIAKAVAQKYTAPA